MKHAGSSANHIGRPVRHSQTLTPTSVNAANSWLDVPKIVQNVRNPHSGGAYHRYTAGPATVASVAIAPPVMPPRPVNSWKTYRPSRVHTSSVSNTKLL